MKTTPSNHSSRRPDLRASVLRYGMAAVVIVICFIIRLLLNPVLGNKGPYAAFVIAVIIAVWIGGLRVGLFTVFVSAIIADYYFVNQKHDIGFHTVNEIVNGLLPSYYHGFQRAIPHHGFAGAFVRLGLAGFSSIS